MLMPHGLLYRQMLGVAVAFILSAIATIAAAVRCCLFRNLWKVATTMLVCVGWKAVLPRFAARVLLGTHLRM